MHRAVQHSAIVPLRHHFQLRDGLALVYPWAQGEVLYHPTAHAHGDRAAPDSPMARFRRLPVPDILRALDEILDAHLAVEQAGLVAVDLYDGCFLYDFESHRMVLCDLDEYRPGPFILEDERLPGARRYMAPEEFVSGSIIDIRTTVFVLGRALRLLLDAGDEEQAWRGTGTTSTHQSAAQASRPSPLQPRVRMERGRSRPPSAGSSGVCASPPTRPAFRGSMPRRRLRPPRGSRGKHHA